MSKRQAQKLHNGDEVICKADGEICQVLEYQETKTGNGSIIVLTVLHPTDGLTHFPHTDVK